MNQGQMLPGVGRATIVKAVAIYLVIAGIFGLCGGVALLGVGALGGIVGIGGASVLSGVDSLGGEGAAAAAGLAAASGLAVILSIFLIIEAPVMLVVAYGLFQRKAWARMGTVIVVGISVILNLLQLTTGGGLGNLVWLVISGFVAYFFYTDPGIQQELSG